MVNQADINSMADLMRKLDTGSKSAAQSVVTESRITPDLGVAIELKRTETGVTVSRYDIKTTKRTIQEGLKKTFYSVIDNRTGDVVYDELGLFESAMGIVKHLLYTNNIQKVERILELDLAYTSTMVETFGYKHRMKHLNESTTQHDVAAAKYSNARTKLSSIKLKLLKSL